MIFQYKNKILQKNYSEQSGMEYRLKEWTAR